MNTPPATPMFSNGMSQAPQPAPVREALVSVPVSQALINPVSDTAAFAQALTEVINRMDPRDDNAESAALDTAMGGMPVTLAVSPMLSTLAATPVQVEAPVEVGVEVTQVEVGVEVTPANTPIKKRGPVQEHEVRGVKRAHYVNIPTTMSDSDQDI